MTPKSLLGALAASTFLLLLACTPKTKSAEPPPDMPAERRALYVQSYDATWSKIKERHFDTAKVGAEWDATHTRLRTKVEAARTPEEARAATNELIASLNQSHFGVLPAEAYEDIDGAASGADGGPDDSGEPGFELREIAGVAVVTRIAAGSPAEQAGVKRGWALVAVNGKSVAPILERLNKAHGDSRSRGMSIAVALHSLVRGPVDSPKRFEFLDGQDKIVVIPITLREPAGSPVEFGNLPTMFLEIDRTQKVADIGYFWFSVWFDPRKVMTELQSAVQSCSGCKGFIIDLRGNIGGIGALAMGVGGWFVDKPDQRLGTLITRESRLNFVLNPRPGAFMGPLAILVDEMSASTSEIFAAGMRDIGRARVFGSPTPGAALPSTVEVLPSGDRLQFAFANYISAKGEPLEAMGVQIDEIVPLTREALLAGNDPQLDAAVAWIRSQAK